MVTDCHSWSLHVPLEQAAYAIPSEDGKMVVWAGNQNPRRTQTSIASALGVPINKVDARVRRVGGAYGGKLNAHLPTCVVAAVAARKMRAPVAVHHERCDDMSSGGHRSPVSATWSSLPLVPRSTLSHISATVRPGMER